MTKSNTAHSGCFSGVLRLLLCKPSVPTHPSDKITSPTSEFEAGTRDLSCDETRAEPGIVARLMGLESNWVLQQRSPNTVFRSKSVNYVDYLLEFDLAQAPPHHRRVRTSASFRELLPSVNPENDLLLVCLSDAGAESTEKSSNVRKFDPGFGVKRQGKDEIKEKIKQSGLKKKTKEIQRKKLKISNLKDEPRRDVRTQNSSVGKSKAAKDLGSVNPKWRHEGTPLMSQKQASSESRVGKKKGKKQGFAKKMNTLLDTENLSPISVLDVENLTCNDPEMTAMKKKDKESEDYTELVGNILRLTEEDIRCSKWMVKSSMEFEEICRELEQQILDVQLLHVVYQIGQTGCI